MNIEALARPCISNHELYVPGKSVEEVKKELGLTDIIKLASNENPFGTSPKAVEAMKAEVEKVFQYPVPHCPELLTAISERYGVPENCIYIDNGGDGVLIHIMMAFVNPGDEVISADVTFPDYRNFTANMDGKMVEIPLTADKCFDLEGILAAVTDRTKLIFICNPNNPTGTIISKEQFADFLSRLPDHVLVVMDEAYADFADPAVYPDSIAALKDHENLMVIRTFSKVYGLAGTRCGYMLSSEAVIHEMMKVREPFPVNRIAQAGALAAMQDMEFMEKTVRNNEEGREVYYRAFEELGLRYWKSQANFVFADTGRSAAEVGRKMMEQGVIIRPCGGMGEPSCIRITVGTPEENARAIRALKKALE